MGHAPFDADPDGTRQAIESVLNDLSALVRDAGHLTLDDPETTGGVARIRLVIDDADVEGLAAPDDLARIIAARVRAAVPSLGSVEYLDPRVAP